VVVAAGHSDCYVALAAANISAPARASADDAGRLAAAEAIEQVTGLRVGLKWPNDVVIQQKVRFLKLGGILSEASIAGEAFEFAVVGWG